MTSTAKNKPSTTASATTAYLLDKAIIWITLASLVIIPLIFSYFDFTAVFNELKLITLHLSAILIIIFWTLETLLNRLDPRFQGNKIAEWDLMKWAGRNPARWALSAAGVWVLAQIASTLLSPLPIISFFGGDESRSGYNLYDSLSLTVIFLSIAFRFRSTQRLKLLAYTLVTTGTIAAAYAIAQHFGWDPIGNNLVLRVQASFGNTLNFGGYMVMTIPATLAVVHIKRSRIWLPFAIIAAALSLQLAGIWFSGGRGPFVATLASVITLFIFTIAIGSRRETIKTLMLFVIATSIATILIILPSPKGDLGLSRFTGIANQFTNSTTTPTESTNITGGLAGRFNIWGSSLKLATNWKVPIEEPATKSFLRPFFGVGPDMFVYSYPLIAQPSSWLRLVDHTHNYELQILMEQGFIGFIGFTTLIAFLTISIFSIIKRYRNTKCDLDLTGIVILALLPATIGKIFELQSGVARVSDLAMTLALFGAVIAIYEILNQRTKEVQTQTLNQPSFTLSSVISRSPKIKIIPGALVGLAVTLLMLSVFVNWDVRRISASRVLVRGHDNPSLPTRAKAWADSQAMAPERASFTFGLFETYLETAKEQYALGNTNEAMRLLMTGREMLLVYEQRDPLELDIQIGLSKTTSTLAEWGHHEYNEELIFRSQKLASIAPAYPTLLGTTATAMTSVGLHELAVQYADRAIATEATTKPWSKAWYAKGRSLFQLGQEKEGIIALQTATEKQPGTEGALLAHQLLAAIYRTRGNTELSEFHATLGSGDITVDE